MSWNHLSHDDCAYKNDLIESVSPLAYVLDPAKYHHCNTCRNQIGVIGGTNVSHISGNLVLLENDLRGQTRPLTHCAQYKHQPIDAQKRYIERIDPLKQIRYAPVDQSLRHLQPCQMIDYKGVPLPPPLQVSSCRK